MESNDEDDDDCKTVKCSLRKLCREDKKWIELIQEKVVEMDKIVTEAYHLLNLHVRRLLEEGSSIPPLKANYLREFLTAVSMVKKQNRKKIELNAAIQTTKERYYDPIRKGKQIPGRDGLKDCISYAAKDMEVAITNNIQMRFFKRQYRYLRFKYPDLTKEDIHQLQNRINTEDDSDTEPYGHISLPAEIKKSVAYDLQMDPWKFLLPMYNMIMEMASSSSKETDNDNNNNKKKESTTSLKGFSLLPLRRGFVPRFIHIDNTSMQSWVAKTPEGRKYQEEKKELRKALKDLEEKEKGKEKEKDKSTESTNKPKRTKIPMSDDQKDGIWNHVFRLNLFRVSKKKFSFGHHLMTDGISVSALFHKKKDSTKNSLLSPLPTINKKNQVNQSEKSTSDLKDLLTKNIVGVDPGKHSIVYMVDKSSKRMRYTNVQRRFEMNTPRFQRKLLELKSDELKLLEAQLSRTNSRSPSLSEFQKYLKVRSDVEVKLYQLYSNLRYRIYRWWSFQYKQKSEGQLIKRIEKTFGKDIVLAYGTWNNPNQMKGLVPSPTCGMRRLLSRHFKVVNTSEYNTTKKCSLCKEGWAEPVKKRLSPKWLRKGVKRSQDVRGLRRCNNEECAAYHNRDHNAAVNIRNNLIYFIQHGKWNPFLSNNNNNNTLL